MLTPTNLLLVMCSHRSMHANPGINERGGGGGYSTVFTRLEARLLFIKINLQTRLLIVTMQACK